jgi:hypothetical protein
MTPPSFSPEQRIEIFSRAVEPTLQRELKHKGAASGDGSYSAELIVTLKSADSLVERGMLALFTHYHSRKPDLESQ